MSRFLIVELEADLDARHTTKGVIFTLIRLIRGVLRVTDIEVVSRATLDEWLLPEDHNYQTITVKRTRKKRS